MAAKRVKIVSKKKKPSEGSAPRSPEASASGTASGASRSRPVVESASRFAFEVPPGVAEGARDLFMAGMGALSALEETGRQAYALLVQRGETWERESKTKMMAAKSGASTAASGAQQMAAQAAEFAQQVGSQLEASVERAVEHALDRMGLPTADDLAALRQDLDRLAARVESTAAASASASGPAEALYRVGKHPDGWAVEREGAQRASGVFDTKAEAVDHARGLGHAQAPATVVVFKADGSEQKRIRYDA